MSESASASFSDDEDDFSAPQTPSLPEVDGVDEIFRTHRPATSGWSDLHKKLIVPKNEYEYKRLKPNQIRILELQKGEPHHDIECRLITKNLKPDSKAHLPYQALSYVWGIDDPREPIRILDHRHQPGQTATPEAPPSETQTLGARLLVGAARVRANNPTRFNKFYVRSNLYNALKQLRRKDVDLWLWVDAICINQNDTEEKNVQLARIHEIYNKALNVCIWLGEADEGGKSDRAMDFIHDAVNFRLLDGLVSLNDVETIQDRARDWDCLADLMSASWFSRRWVVQEVALARRASIQCGAKSVNWVNFADAVANFVMKLDDVKALYRKVNLPSYNPDSLTFIESLGAKIMVSTITNLFRKSEEGNILDRLVNLETLVSTLLTFDAGNPRDIIYALLSIAKDSPLAKARPREQDQGAMDLLKPNYAKDALEVYTDFVKHCINSGSLDIICRHWAVQIRKEQSRAVSEKMRKLQPLLPLPSWIGLLEDSPFGPPDRLTGRVNGDSLVGLPYEHRYNASDRLKPECTWEQSRVTFQPPVSPTTNSHSFSKSTPTPASTDPLLVLAVSLKCRGITLDRISRISDRMINATISRECLDLGGWQRSEDGTIPKQVPDRLWRTLVADRGPDGHNPPSWYHRACLHCLATTSPSGDINTGELIRDSTSPQLMVEYLKRVQCVVWSRRVMVADSEEDNSEPLFGLAPEKAEVGDVIAILFGCSVPVILREHIRDDDSGGLYYEFIGESYVHGKMDGEALSNLTQEEIQAQSMEFCLW
jgi:Heterokaryon incompatibility protein (HET)